MSSSQVKHSIISKKMAASDFGWEDRGWKFYPEELAKSPSLKTMSRHDEKTLKRNVHTFLFECGKRLKMKTLVMAASATICQRYYAQRSFKDIPRYHVGSAALLLASKAEEFPASMEDILMVAYDVWNNTDRYPEKRKKYFKSQMFEENATKLALAERALMCSINFDFNIEHAYPYVYEVVETCGKNGWLKAKEQFAAVKGAISLLNQSLRGTMCLEYPPSYRARLVLFVALLCNGIPAPAETEENWAFALEFGGEQRLKRACCQLLDCLDEDEGQTGIKLTRTMVLEALVITGFVRSLDPNSKPRAPRSFDERKEAGKQRASASGKTLGKRQSSDDAVTEWPCPPPPSSSDAASALPASTLMPPPEARPRPKECSNSAPSSTLKPAATPKFTPASSPRPRPPLQPPSSAQKPRSSPKPPPVLKPPSGSKPRPPSSPKPRSSPKPPPVPKPPSGSKPRPPSSPKPRSSPKPPPVPKPPSGSKPRPPSSPKPRSSPKPPPVPKPPSGSKPRPPSYPKPPSVPKPPPVPKPPSDTKPRPPSSPKPPSATKSASAPKPPSAPKAPAGCKPRPPSAPQLKALQFPSSTLRPSASRPTPQPSALKASTGPGPRPTPISSQKTSAVKSRSQAVAEAVASGESNVSSVGKRCRHGPGADSADTAGRKKHRLSGEVPGPPASGTFEGDEMEDGEITI